MTSPDPKDEPPRGRAAPRNPTAVRMTILDPKTGQAVTIEVRPR